MSSSTVRSDRVFDTLQLYEFKESSTNEKLDAGAISGNGKNSIENGVLKSSYSGEEGVYQVKIKLPKKHKGNGVSVRIKVEHWESIRYLAVGYTLPDNSFRHIKVPNTMIGELVEVDCAHYDLAFKIQNGWEDIPDQEIGDVRVYIKGCPSSPQGLVSLEKASVWLEQKDNFCLNIHGETTTYHDLIDDQKWLPNQFASPSKTLMEAFYQYWAKCFPDAEAQAEGFILHGLLPLQGGVCLKWNPLGNHHQEISKSVTYKFAWHAFTPAVILLMRWHDQKDMGSLIAAREYVAIWLNDSFFKPDEDQKYTWYDHGTAERLVAMLMLWAEGLDFGFDQRFMARLLYTIHRHAQLLDSEAFYASHQPTRYHNHAWFQDMALMAASLAIPEFTRADAWLSNALGRLEDQFDQLIVRDNGFAVFVENSIGYHHGIQRLAEFAGKLASFSEHLTAIPEVAIELEAWSEYLRYPDGRSPSQGDTFRRPNPKDKKIRRGKPYKEPQCTVLPKAGYAVVKGNHDNLPFMLCMFATSLCQTHKHEDNLSITLFFDGIEWLIDPSFHSHEYDQPIPAYLRSARAHNNVYLEGVNYSITPGKASLSGKKVKNQQFIIAGEHTAYENYNATRELSGTLSELALTGIDRIQSKGKARPTPGYLLFHCGEDIEVVNEKDAVLLRHPDSAYLLRLTCDAGAAKIYKGWNEKNNFQSVAGHGFMQSNDTSTVVFSISDTAVCSWQIAVRRRNEPEDQ